LSDFPGGKSELILVAAGLRHIAGTKWGMSQYMKVDWLDEEIAESIEV
jgi:putative transposase